MKQRLNLHQNLVCYTYITCILIYILQSFTNQHQLSQSFGNATNASQNTVRMYQVPCATCLTTPGSHTMIHNIYALTVTRVVMDWA